jgi:peptide/nickel transport system permease protein
MSALSVPVWRPRDRWARRRIARRPAALVAYAVFALVVLATVVGPLVMSTDPGNQDGAPLLGLGSPGHLLGTDDLGRDELARLVYGGRPLLEITFGSVPLAAVVGSLLGMLAGYHGGLLDTVVMRLMDLVLAFPLVLLAILLVATLGGDVLDTIWAVTLSQLPYFARLARNLTVREAGRDYVRSARALGLSGWHVLSREIAPNLAGPLVVQATSIFAVAAGLASGLAYLGLGEGPATPDWGYMVKAGQEYVYNDPMLAVLPGVLITVFVVACNFIGDDLRDVLDPERGT